MAHVQKLQEELDDVLSILKIIGWCSLLVFVLAVCLRDSTWMTGFGSLTPPEVWVGDPSLVDVGMGIAAFLILFDTFS